MAMGVTLLLLAIAYSSGSGQAVTVGQAAQSIQKARAVIQSSDVALTNEGNQVPGETGTAVTQVETCPTALENGVDVNVAVLAEDLVNEDHYFQFTLQTAPDAAFPAGRLRVRYEDSASTERAADIVVEGCGASVVPSNRTAGATIRLPATSDANVTMVAAVFEETLSVSGEQATVSLSTLSVAGLTAP